MSTEQIETGGGTTNKVLAALLAICVLLPGTAAGAAATNAGATPVTYAYPSVNGVEFFGLVPATSPYVAAEAYAYKHISLGRIVYKGVLVARIEPELLYQGSTTLTGTWIDCVIYPTEAYLHLSSSERQGAAHQVVSEILSVDAVAWYWDRQYLQDEHIQSTSSDYNNEWTTAVTNTDTAGNTNILALAANDFTLTATTTNYYFQGTYNGKALYATENDLAGRMETLLDDSVTVLPGATGPTVAATTVRIVRDGSTVAAARNQAIAIVNASIPGIMGTPGHIRRP